MSQARLKYAVAMVLVLSVGGAALAARRPAAPKADAGPPPSANAVMVSEAMDRFAFNLYGRLQGQPGNLFFSPESISTALAMAWCGARGQTAAEMEGVLGFQPDRPVRPEWVSQAYGDFLAYLKGGGAARGYELSAANAIWAQKGYGVLPDYLALLDKNFGAGLKEVDFAGDAEGARKAVNAWAEKETREKIKDLLLPGAVQPATRVILTNAIYFKGKWTEPFKKDQTKDADFFLAPDKKVSAPLMNLTERFPYFDGGAFQALEMPYAGDALAMVILLPREKDGLAALEKSLSAEKFAEWTAKLAKREVVVAVPKFKMTSTFMLGGTLAAMGMPLAFQAGKADFTGITGGKEPFWIGEVIHKAFVDVNEEGTEAAAATAIMMLGAAMPAAPPPVFRADHPFVFLIRDKRSGCILFVGRVVNPKE